MRSAMSAAKGLRLRDARILFFGDMPIAVTGELIAAGASFGVTLASILTVGVLCCIVRISTSVILRKTNIHFLLLGITGELA